MNKDRPILFWGVSSIPDTQTDLIGEIVRNARRYSETINAVKSRYMTNIHKRTCTPLLGVGELAPSLKYADGTEHKLTRDASLDAINGQIQGLRFGETYSRFSHADSIIFIEFQSTEPNDDGKPLQQTYEVALIFPTGWHASYIQTLARLVRATTFADSDIRRLLIDPHNTIETLSNYLLHVGKLQNAQDEEEA